MALLDPLLPRRDQLILGALVLHPERSYSVNELLRIGGASKSTGAAIVNRLVEGGIARDERVGNQRRVRLNTSWPLVAELRSLCVKSFGMAEPIKAALATLLAKIDLAFIFGSVVKGADHHESDIDLMVVGSISMDELMNALQAPQEQLGRHIQFTLYTPAEWRRLRNDGVIQSILQGPKWVLHERG